MPPKQGFAEKAKSTQDSLMDGQMDWGPAKGGNVFEVLNFMPCCSPYCIVTWWLCGQCNQCQQFAWATDQPCSVVNHMLPIMYLPMFCFIRHAIRKRVGVQAGGPLEGLVGDCICGYCCGCCTFCQQLRATSLAGGDASWDCVSALKDKRVALISKPCKSFPPFMG